MLIKFIFINYICSVSARLINFAFRKIGYVQGLLFLQKHGVFYNSAGLQETNVLKSQQDFLNVLIAQQEFLNACANNELRLAKNLLSAYPHINLSVGEETAFRWACSSGHLDVAKWLLSIKPDINVSISNNHAFYMAALYGDDKNLNVTKWLLSIKPDIINSNIINSLLPFAVFKGKPEIIKLIIENKPIVDLSNAFIEACRLKCNISKHIIQSTNVFKYSVKNNCINANWEFYVLVYILKKTNNLNTLSLWKFAEMFAQLRPKQI